MQSSLTKRSKILAALIILGIVSVGLFWFRSRPYFATVYLLPPADLRLDTTVSLPLFVDTKDEVINAGEIYLSFDPKVIEIEAVSTEKSIFSLWITNQPAFSNERGEISFAGGLPTPGFHGQGQIGSVKVRLKKEGESRISFSDKTRFLKNDGKGTALPLRQNPVTLKIQAK